MKFREWLESVRPQEGDEMITLYRGDAQQIKSFSLDKADPAALFGAGIYFTDSPRLGNDYTAKGQDVLFKYGGNWGPRKANKQEAIEAYIWRLAQYIDENGNDIQWGKSLPALTTNPERVARMKHAEEKWNQMKKDLEVRAQTDGTIVIRKKSHPGITTAIQVPKRVLQHTLDAESPPPQNVIEALYYILKKLGDVSTAKDMYDFATRDEYEGEDGWEGSPTWRQIYTSITRESPIAQQNGQIMLRQALKRLGYTGIRYAGGVTMGGRRHNAYVFWDEQGINKLPRTTRKPRRRS